MQLWLIDTKVDLVRSWKSYFSDFENVFISEGNILDKAECSIVSPANSYGFMDGGIDRLYRDFFGPKVEKNLQKTIKRRAEGYIPIGSAEIIRTGHSHIPYLIAAPTMVTPAVIPSQNVFYAMMAILQIASLHREIRSIYCPGLGTGIGQVSLDLAAQEMSSAYEKWLNSQMR